MKQPDNILAMVLKSGQCDWGNCIYCGWGKLDYSVDENALRKDFDRRIRDAPTKGIDTIKIFTSGSFLDDNQFPRAFQRFVVERCAEIGVKHIITESLPKFITEEKLEFLKHPEVKITMSYGLEVGTDEERKKIGKGFTNADFERTVALLRKHGYGVRCFILVNPPNVPDVIKSLEETVSYARKFTDTMVLINTFPHGKSHLFHMWVSGGWKPMSSEDFYKITAPYKDIPGVELDDSNFQFMPMFPKEKQKWIVGASAAELHHPHYEVWQDYFTRLWKPPAEKQIALFVPCSFQKPYFRSQTHKAITKALALLPNNKSVHRLVLSTPGVIPFEFANFYPFNQYDWPEWEETPEIKQMIIDVTYERMKKFLAIHKNHYKAFYVFMKKDSECRQGLERACRELGIKLIDCVPNELYEEIKDVRNPVISGEALGCLLEELTHQSSGQRELATN
jgi:hypothetical protein